MEATARESPGAHMLLGRRGEELAAAYLERRGYEILARNHRTREGELDLIVRDGASVAFVEVKTRRARACAAAAQPSPVACEPALFSPAPRQRQRQRRLALAWLAEQRRRPRARDLRFDLIRVLVADDGALAAIEHVRGAW